MNKKAFTLAELLGVIIILFALFLIAIPSVDRVIKNSKEKVLNEQIETIKNSMRSWVYNNQKPDNGETITLSLYQLKSSGLIDLDIKNPNTKKLFPNDIILTIKNNNGILEYNVDLNSSIDTPYEELDSLTLNGDALEYIELGSGFIEKNTLEGNASISYPINFNIGQIGSYLVTYSKGDNKIYRTVVVRDTKPPVISFSSSLTVSLNEIDTYNYNMGVTCTDSSSYTLEADTSLLPKNTGTYSIKYTCKDNSGNESYKYRDVIITD